MNLSCPSTALVAPTPPARRALLVALCLLLAPLLPSPDAAAAAAAAEPAASAVEQRTRGLTHGAGFVPFWWDARGGKLLLEVPAFDTDVLYYVSAASGGGSVELPLDRGVLSSQVVHFRREGSRVLVVQQNLEFRALDAGAARAANVAASFPVSVLASLPVEAESGGRVVVDGSALFLRDAGGIVSDLRRANQGGYRFDATRTSFLPASMKAFPDNTEIETLATFASDAPGVVTAGVTPDASALSLRIHHSFLRAPTGYTPRRADPRIGVSSIDFRDHGQPVDNGLEVEWITRWRLEKKDPAAAMSEPVKPIVFYLDPAIPEPYRSAMKAGTLWWNEAFEAAGFRNAVQVADPTPDMDPMDIRYAWVLWIDRDERGFSSGGTYRDPRTGEILGSKTRMDSHRIRTIANYWEAYMPASVRPDGATPEALTRLTMLRQSLLVAHELGHALGFSHNFASSLNDRASVMEYPSPRLRVVEGKLDLSQAFQDRIGDYDKYMARYAYSVLPAASERSTLDALIAEMRGSGILFVPSTDPRWTWYDDRATPMEYLTETAAARRILLAQYGQDVLKPGEPVGALRDLRLWMVYLHQRWAIESGVGYVGGQFHEFAVRGDGVKPTQVVPAATQREVLRLLLDVIEPANLAMPDALLEQLTPHPGTNLEDLSGDYAFDHLRAARILSALVLEPLLAPERAARLVTFSDRDMAVPSLPEVVDAIVARTWGAADKDRRAAALRRVTQRVALDALMMLGANANATPDVRSYVLDRLARLGADIGARKSADPMAGAHLRQAARDIDAYLADPAARAPKSASPAWGKRPRSRYPSPPGPPL